MKMSVRKSEDRGQAELGWLSSRHTFSFSSYYDDRFLGFRDLRVINEDRVEPSEGFPMHPHRSMEILTYVVSGKLEHRDSLNHHGIVGPGEVQYMSAGDGVVHSEFNASSTDPVHFIQIWIIPEKQGGKADYGQKAFSNSEKKNRLQVLASPDGREGSIAMRQNALIYATHLEANRSLEVPIQPTRSYWVQVIQGSLEVNEQALESGDGLALQEASVLKLSAKSFSEVLLFDLN